MGIIPTLSQLPQTQFNRESYENQTRSRCSHAASRLELLELLKEAHAALLGQHIPGLPSRIREAIAKAEAKKEIK